MTDASTTSMDQSEEDLNREDEQDQLMERRSHRLELPEDGYEWKKYGQKFIKNIAKFRSYFKCQRENCMAKKRAEWSSKESGEMRIVYEGVHTHDSSLTHQHSSSSSSTSSSSTNANQYNLLTQVRGGDHHHQSTSQQRPPHN